MQQRTPPAVAVLGGVPAAAQNVAGPSQHALQPVTAAPLPPLVTTTAPSRQEPDTITEVQPNANTTHALPTEASAFERDVKTVSTGPATASLQATTNHTDSTDRPPQSQAASPAPAQDWNYGCGTSESNQGETDGTGTAVHSDTKERSLSKTTKLEYKQSLSASVTDSGQEKPNEMEPPQVASLGQASQASHLSQPDGLDTRLQGLCESQTLSAVTDGSDDKQTERSELTHAAGDGVRTAETGAVQGDPMVGGFGELSATLRTPTEITQPVLPPGNGKSACYSDADGDETDGYLHRSPSVPSQAQHNSGQAKEEALKGLAYSSAVQKTIAPLVSLPLQTSELSHDPHELKTMTEPTMATHAALSELNQHEMSSEVLVTSKNPNLTTGETNISLAVDVEQVLQNVPLHGGVCQDVSGKGILSNLSATGESKVLGEGACTETILAVTDAIQAVVTGSADVILNDGLTVSQVQLSLSPDHQQTNNISVANSEACESLEVLDPQLLATSQIDSELLTQQMPSPIPAADTFSEMEVCTNAEGIIETQTTEIHTHVLRDLGQVCFLQTDLVSDLASLPVEILEHEVEEGAWLEVTDNLGDGQVVECSETQLMDVTDEAHCLETQTIEVSECTVVTYPSDAILSHGQLHLPDSLEVPQVCESGLGSSVELLTEDLGTDTPSPHNGVAALKADPEPSSVSYVESATAALTPTAALVDHPDGQGVEELLAADETEVSPGQRPPGAINPKLLILKRGETPLLKHPPDLLAVVSKKQSPVSTAQAGDPSCASVPASAGAFVECLSPSSLAAVSAAAEPDETHTSISQPDSVPCKLTFTTEEEALPSAHTLDGTPSLSTAQDGTPRRVGLVSRPRQPLMGGWSEVCDAIGSKKEAGGSAAGPKRSTGDEIGQGGRPHSPSLDTAGGGDSSDGEADLSMESHADTSMATPTLAQRKVRSTFNHNRLPEV